MISFKLWYIVILVILFINTDRFIKINAEAKNSGFIQRELNLDSSDKLKNIFVGSIVGGISHLNPMLEISKILKDRGHNVTLVAPGNFTAKSTLYHSIPQIIIGEPPNPHDSMFKKIIFNKYTFKVLAGIIEAVVAEKYTKHFNDYLQAYKEIKADLFFCDYLGNWACFDLAWKLNKPVVVFVNTLSFLDYNFLPPFISDPLMDCRVNMENESLYNRFMCAIVQRLRVTWLLRNSFNTLNYKSAEIGVSKYGDIKERLANTLILVDSFIGFEVSFAWPPLLQEIGPILPDIFPNLTSDLELFLSTHPRVMYISLGTSVYLTQENTAILLQSAIELINQNILDGVIWATARFNESELPSTVTLSNGDVIPILNLLNNLYPHFHITKFAPQFAILSHENTKVYLGQGGVGSSHESMYTATPMLVLPVAYDQLANAEKLELTGMALKLSKIDLKVDDIKSKVIRLMNEESFKMNAKRMQVLAKFNSKRKYRGADLIEMLMNLAKCEGVMNEDNELEIDNRVLLRHWITPDSRMGFIRGKYLDVFGVAVIISIALVSCLGYVFYKTIKFVYKKLLPRDENMRKSPLKRKNE
ncbi:UDP-Glycosyltransferase/glycogen phosphorylase [Gigaspora margarita]|uniref:UDP-Glycosyltransferase/glycogen phosphorylase n=1 Tax=Gigaspora margarita TaxID=4874 RepID=A0A8H3XC10_GIGMA|nr:UDP-Glycosyltransferase/glycogen phosphorylase [Gigaspora margarita]